MRRWQIWVGLIVSLFFLVWALRQVNSFGEVWAALASANYVLIVPALAAYFLGVWFRALRWRCLLTPLRNIPAGRLFPVVVIGYMANDVLPARMGELVRAYVLAKEEGISKSSSLATIFIERVFDGIVLLLFAVVVSLFVPLDEGLTTIVRIAAVIFLLAVVGFFSLAFWPNTATRGIALATKALPPGVRPRINEIGVSFVDGLQALLQGRLLVSALALSIVAWLCEATMYYIIGVGFALSQPFYVFVLNTVVANLGTMVPSSPGYVGTFEALSVFTLGLFKVNPDLAMSYTLVLHVVLLVPVTLLGFFYLWRHHLSLAVIRRQPIVTNANLNEERSG
ncbi:MAG: flippase-like domain-containing protein [Chloroflexi bacterium]|nr:flippase-like domain-containing protein [Chloroflexota bacterium]